HSPPGKEGQRRRDRGAEGWFTKPKTSPPRRYAPPLVEEGKVEKRSPPAKEGQRRRDRGAEGWLRNQTSPPRRFAPPLLDEEGKVEKHSPPVKEGQRRRDRGAEGRFTKPKTSELVPPGRTPRSTY